MEKWKHIGVIGPNLFEVQEDINLFGYIIKMGFKTDGGSLPWFATWLFRRVGVCFLAFVLHDYLYCTEMSRKEADKVLKRTMMICLKDRNKLISKISVSIAYITVRLCGWMFYQERGEQWPLVLSSCTPQK